MSKTDDMFERSRKKEQQKRDFDTRQFLDSIGKMNTYGTVHISRQSVITNIVKVLYGFVSITNL